MPDLVSRDLAPSGVDRCDRGAAAESLTDRDDRLTYMCVTPSPIPNHKRAMGSAGQSTPGGGSLRPTATRLVAMRGS
jgi:hypothetical protein